MVIRKDTRELTGNSSQLDCVIQSDPPVCQTSGRLDAEQVTGLIRRLFLPGVELPGAGLIVTRTSALLDLSDSWWFKR